MYVISDYQPLRLLMNWISQSNRLARWAHALQFNNLKIDYDLRHSKVIADTLLPPPIDEAEIDIITIAVNCFTYKQMTCRTFETNNSMKQMSKRSSTSLQNKIAPLISPDIPKEVDGCWMIYYIDTCQSKIMRKRLLLPWNQWYQKLYEDISALNKLFTIFLQTSGNSRNK